MSAIRASRRRASLAAAGAVAGVVMLVTTWYAAFHVGIVERADVRILHGFTDLGRRRVDSLAQRIAELCNPNPFLYLAAIPLTIALARRRRRAAIAIATILLGANTTTHLLKPLLASGRAGPMLHGHQLFYAASWPSGHATAAMSFTLCMILALPARWRGVAAAAGAAFTVAVVYSFLTLGWHFPSDVLGGFLVAGTWTLVAVACVWAVESRDATRMGERDARPTWAAALGPPALALAGALVLAALVAVARPHEVADYARAHTTFVVGAAAIAAAALVLATGLMLAVSRPRVPGSAPAPRAAHRRRSPPG